MQLKTILKSKVVIIILLQIFSKITGVLREIILLNFFQGSKIFADFLKLETYSQLISIFYTESGLSANLMKKFSIINRRSLSFNKIKKQSVIIATIIFFSVFVIQYIANKIVIRSEYNFLPLIFFNALASSLVFYFNIGQIVLLSKSNYSNLYKSNFFRALLYIILLYPLIKAFSLLGAVLNRLISVSFQYFNTWYAVKDKHQENHDKISFSIKDFNLWVFFSNNSLFLWYLILRIYFSFIEGDDIIFLTYGFVFASAFDGIIIKSFSTFILERSLNHNINLKKTILKIVVFSVITIIISYFFSENIFHLIFGKYGSFETHKIKQINSYFIVLLILVLSNGINNLVFQKVFAKRRNIQFKYSKIYISTNLFFYFIIVIISFYLDQKLNMVIAITFFTFVINFYFVTKILKIENV